MSKRAFSGLSSNGTLKKRMIGSGKDEDHDVDNMVSHYTEIIEQQKDKEVTGLGSKILNNPTMVRTIYFIFKFGFIVFGLGVCAVPNLKKDNVKKVAVANISKFITNVLTSMKKNPQDFGAITSGLGQLTSGILRPIGSLLSKIPIIGSVINLFSMIETGVSNMNKFITDKILGSLYDQNFMLKLMTLYDTIPVKGSNGKHQWTPANYIKGSAILLSIMNALICGKGNKVCRLSKLLEKLAYFVPVVMMIHGDILVVREVVLKQENFETKRKTGYTGDFCQVLSIIALNESSGLFASENEQINKSANAMGNQATKIRQMLILTDEEKKIKEKEKEKEEEKKSKLWEGVREEIDNLPKKKAEAKAKKKEKIRDLQKAKDEKYKLLKETKEIEERLKSSVINDNYRKQAEARKKELKRLQDNAQLKVEKAKKAVTKAVKNEHTLVRMSKQSREEVERRVKNKIEKERIDAELKRATEKLAAARKRERSKNVFESRRINRENAKDTSARTPDGSNGEQDELVHRIETKMNENKNLNSAQAAELVKQDMAADKAKAEKRNKYLARARAKINDEQEFFKEQNEGNKMSFLNNPDTSINPDYYRKFNPDFTRDVVTPAEKNVAQKKVAAEAEKAATRRRSLAKLAPSGISFLSGLFGSKKNKKSNKKKSNKKKTK